MSEFLISTQSRLPILIFSNGVPGCEYSVDGSGASDRSFHGVPK